MIFCVVWAGGLIRWSRCSIALSPLLRFDYRSCAGLRCRPSSRSSLWGWWSHLQETFFLSFRTRTSSRNYSCSCVSSRIIRRVWTGRVLFLWVSSSIDGWSSPNLLITPLFSTFGCSYLSCNLCSCISVLWVRGPWLTVRLLRLWASLSFLRCLISRPCLLLLCTSSLRSGSWGRPVLFLLVRRWQSLRFCGCPDGRAVRESDSSSCGPYWRSPTSLHGVALGTLKSRNLRLCKRVNTF